MNVLPTLPRPHPTIRRYRPAQFEFLPLPETRVPVTSIVVGHPADDPAKRDRLRTGARLQDATCHWPTRKSAAIPAPPARPGFIA